jgi:hypothetical protein
VTVAAEGVVAEAARRHAEWIAGEVLAVEWTVAQRSELSDGEHLVELDGTPVTFSLEVA